MYTTINQNQYVEVTHSLLQPFKIKHGVSTLYIAKPLWNIAIHKSSHSLDGELEMNSAVLRVLYLLETYFLLKDYLAKSYFPIVLPNGQTYPQDKVVEIGFETKQTDKGLSVYFRCSDFFLTDKTIYRDIEYAIYMKLNPNKKMRTTHDDK